MVEAVQIGVTMAKRRKENLHASVELLLNSFRIIFGFALSVRQLTPRTDVRQVFDNVRLIRKQNVEENKSHADT